MISDIRSAAVAADKATAGTRVVGIQVYGSSICVMGRDWADAGPDKHAISLKVDQHVSWREIDTDGVVAIERAVALIVAKLDRAKAAVR